MNCWFLTPHPATRALAILFARMCWDTGSPRGEALSNHASRTVHTPGRASMHNVHCSFHQRRNAHTSSISCCDRAFSLVSLGMPDQQITQESRVSATCRCNGLHSLRCRILLQLYWCVTCNCHLHANPYTGKHTSRTCILTLAALIWAVVRTRHVGS